MQEIERKFLVNTKKWNPKGKGKVIKQGYLSTDPARVVRVRLIDNDAFLTIKGNQKGISRTEIEYPIKVEHAQELIKMCVDFPVEKTRYIEKINGFVWEIDVFETKNKGLVLAEVELEYEMQKVELPEWIEEEVSTDFRYFNSYLCENPFSEW